jgi:hypothetical protein
MTQTTFERMSSPAKFGPLSWMIDMFSWVFSWMLWMDSPLSVLCQLNALLGKLVPEDIQIVSRGIVAARTKLKIPGKAPQGFTSGESRFYP